MESVKTRTAMATKREYRRMEVGEEGEEVDEAEWAHRAEAQRQRRGRGQRYAFSCALFASLNGILLGYGQSMLLPGLSLLLHGLQIAIVFFPSLPWRTVGGRTKFNFLHAGIQRIDHGIGSSFCFLTANQPLK